MSKLIGILLFIAGIVLFIVSLIFIFPLPDYVRIPLILAILTIVAIEAVTNWKTFIENAFKFSTTFLILSLMFIALFIYLGLTNVTRPFILLMIVAVILAIGAYMTKE
jgi:phosphatidylserine synthase